MGKQHDAIDECLRQFIDAQHVFFVATAPSGPLGHVNVSPKGLDSFRVLDPHTVAYLDFIGSGIETIAHVRDSGRICLMFCAFDGPPNILRLHGRGDVIEPADRRFAELKHAFPASPSLNVRAIVVVRVTRISDSCGYGVPLMTYVGDRSQMEAWVERKGPQGLEEYQRRKNSTSLDGLPGLRWTAETVAAPNPKNPAVGPSDLERSEAPPGVGPRPTDQSQS